MSRGKKPCPFHVKQQQLMVDISYDVDGSARLTRLRALRFKVGKSMQPYHQLAIVLSSA